MPEFAELFELLTASIDYVLLVSVVLLAINLSVVKKKSRQQRESLTDKIQELESQIYVVNQGAIGVGRRLIALEKIIRQSGNSDTKVRKIEKALSGMDQAAKLASTGASISDIVKATGIGRAEAQLMKTVRSGIPAVA